ncbi:MAG: glycoside hydrolase family 13 protein [Candidatus Eisenbacteria bacterium]|nr:glycoside hydrolase family 13 protein [Candidatus Eisenbacteria bacterium]
MPGHAEGAPQQPAARLPLPTATADRLDPGEVPGFTTPEWAKHAVWYQVMVDRFRRSAQAPARERLTPWRRQWSARSEWESMDDRAFYRNQVWDRQCGGDLRGLAEAIPYLQALGVNALYLIPVFQAESAHKYNATNYLHIDERYGVGAPYGETEAREDLLDPSTWTFDANDREFLSVLRELKRAGFRVVLDGVFNHVGTRHPAFRDVRERGESSPYADWFEIKSWSPFAYQGWAEHGSLPQFQKDEAHGIASASLREHLFAVTRRWLDPDGDGDPSDGIDGWRLDVPNEVPIAFWREWRAFVKSINPDAYITGEIWKPAMPWLQGDTFDAVMNYEFAAPVVAWVFDRAQRIRASELDRRLAVVRRRHPSEATYVMQNLLDSHDTDRAVSMAANPDRTYNQKNRTQDVPSYDASRPRPEHYRRLRLAALIQMTYVGAPMLWYGTEVGMWGAGDPDNRKPMLWPDHEPYDAPHENHIDEELLAWFQRAIALRRAHEALRTGEFRTVLTDDAREVWAFVRRGAREELLAVFSMHERPQRVPLPLDLGGGWRPVFGEAPDGLADAFPDVAIAGISGRVWVRERAR